MDIYTNGVNTGRFYDKGVKNGERRCHVNIILSNLEEEIVKNIKPPNKLLPEN
jgi:hypothetical protein